MTSTDILFGKDNSTSAKKSARPNEDGSAGGFKGGIPSRPSEKIEASPAACSFRAEPSKILFSLIEKIFQGRAQIKKCKEYFARRRASASGGGAASLVGVLCKMGSDFFKQTPPFQICRRSCLGASPLGIGFRQEIPRGFEFRQKKSR